LCHQNCCLFPNRNSFAISEKSEKKVKSTHTVDGRGVETFCMFLNQPTMKPPWKSFKKLAEENVLLKSMKK
jgi:hypothetical protein